MMQDENGAGRPMTPDELEQHGYPRDFHDRTPDEKLRIEAERIATQQRGETAQAEAQTRDSLAASLVNHDDASAASALSENGPARERAVARFVTAANNPREITRFDRDTVAIIEASVLELGTRIEQYVPEGRLKSLALTHLEETLTWANKALYTQGAVL